MGILIFFWDISFQNHKDINCCSKKGFGFSKETLI
jgi:hypothetical protein